MGVLVQVRDVDERVRDELKAAAKASKQSLNTFLRDVLEREARTQQRKAVIARLQKRGVIKLPKGMSAAAVVRDARAANDAKWKRR